MIEFDRQKSEDEFPIHDAGMSERQITSVFLIES